MMNDHLSQQQMERYRDKRLESGELRYALNHIARCESCNKRFRELPGVPEISFPMQIYFSDAEADDAKHLLLEDLLFYTANRLNQKDRQIVEGHLIACPQCRDELRDLRDLDDGVRRSLNKRYLPPSQPSAWNKYLSNLYPVGRTSWLTVSTAILILLGLISAAILIVVPRPEPSGEQAQVDPSYKEEPKPLPSPQPLEAPQNISQPDGPTPLVTKNSNSKRPVRSKPAQETALIAQELSRPAAIEIFDRSSLAVRGKTDRDEAFGIISPISTLVSTDRPSFRWTALTGADSYTVSLYDSNLDMIETSRSLRETQWAPRKQLRRGNIYTWVVTALKDGKEVVAPAPPRRAEFRIIEKLELARVNRRIKDINSHAARGVIYAEAGLLDEAEQELRIHLTLHPDDERAKKLLETVRSWRDPEPHTPPSPTTTKPAQ